MSFVLVFFKRFTDLDLKKLVEADKAGERMFSRA